VAAFISIDARAQGTADPRVAPELRADVILGSRAAVQVGGGIQVPAGYYVRVGVDAGIGVRTNRATGEGARSSADARVDLLARFLLDPFRQTRYGFSLGGGIGLRAEPDDKVRPVLLVAMDLEGPRSSTGFVPAVQVGLGGGVRIGVIARLASGPGSR
jgi:hypothetical protein